MIAFILLATALFVSCTIGADSESEPIASLPANKLKLVPDVWQVVTEFLKPKDLHSLGMTCRQLRSSTEEFLDGMCAAVLPRVMNLHYPNWLKACQCCNPDLLARLPLCECDSLADWSNCVSYPFFRLPWWKFDDVPNLYFAVSEGKKKWFAQWCEINKGLDCRYRGSNMLFELVERGLFHRIEMRDGIEFQPVAATNEIIARQKALRVAELQAVVERFDKRTIGEYGRWDVLRQLCRNCDTQGVYELNEVETVAKLSELCRYCGSQGAAMEPIVSKTPVIASLYPKLMELTGVSAETVSNWPLVKLPIAKFEEIEKDLTTDFRDVAGLRVLAEVSCSYIVRSQWWDSNSGERLNTRYIAFVFIEESSEQEVCVLWKETDDGEAKIIGLIDSPTALAAKLHESTADADDGLEWGLWAKCKDTLDPESWWRVAGRQYEHAPQDQLAESYRKWVLNYNAKINEQKSVKQ
jgi:hypothetical protein